MNAKMVIPFVVALGLGFAAVRVGQQIIRSRSNSAAEATGELVSVVSAGRDLEAGQTLAASDLVFGQVSPDSFPPGALRDKQQAIGRALSTPLAKGQMLVMANLAPEGVGGGLQALVPSGMRAVTIEVSESAGMEGLLTPGCHVDVVATLADEQSRTAVARTIVEDVTVSAVGTQISTARQSMTEREAPKVSRTVTLTVTPRQAESIDLACSRGRPRLVLRSSSDKGLVMTAGVTLAELIRMGAERAGAVIEQKNGSVKTVVSVARGMFDRLAAKPAPEGSGEAAKPTTRPTVVVLQRSVQVIKAGAETTKSFQIIPTASTVEVVEAGAGSGSPPAVPGQ